MFCIGYNIPDWKVSESFSNSVYFTHANFQNINFSNSKFQKVDFGEAIFNKQAIFKNCKFEQGDFLGVKFSIVDFSKTKFQTNVNFSEVVFQEVDFSDSNLNAASFIGTIFEKIDFSGATIEEGDFFKSEFNKRTNFIGSKIKRTNLPRVRFNDHVSFMGSKIEETNFNAVKFHSADFTASNLKVVEFFGSDFTNQAEFVQTYMFKVNFPQVVFQKSVSFSESELEEVGFQNSKFNISVFSKNRLNLIDFTKTKFQNTADFTNSILKNINFIKTEFNNIDFSNAEMGKGICFSLVNFKIPEEAIFDVVDMSKVSFIDSDISCVRFGEKVRFGGNDKLTILGEEDLDENSPREEIEKVLACYRSLRKNFEKRFRFEDADIIFSKESKLKSYLKLEGELEISENEIIIKKINDLTLEVEQLKNKIKILESNKQQK